MEQQFETYDSVQALTKAQAEAMATQKVDFCNGLYTGYICDLPHGRNDGNATKGV